MDTRRGDWREAPSDFWWSRILACPDCRASLELTAGTACACGFRIPPGESLDLRPQRPSPRELHFDIGRDPRAVLAQVVTERPAITVAVPPGARDSRELFSAVAGQIDRGAHLLDLGCGPRDQASVAETLGLLYVGVDVASQTADLLADAHAIPFRDGSFDAVLAYAVLEHLHNPFVGVAEVERVLAPGGVFFGAVSQGEPFHDSYFHHTFWGTATVIASAGLKLVRAWPSHDTLHALSTMGRYARVVRVLIEAVHRFSEAAPFLAPRKRWRWPEGERQLDRLHRAASVCYVAMKT